MPAVPFSRVKEVFLNLIELPAEERAAALDRECEGDAGLRAEVESLLAHHSDESLLAPRGKGEAAAVEGGDLASSAPLLEAGQKVGNFRVVKMLGQGGMGTVYEAMHQYIERRAAIKVLHPHLSQNPQYKNRFLNEARTVNLIQHPGLIEIFEFGLLDTGTAFAIMEFLEGEPLTQRMRRAAESGAGLADEALEIAHQIAQAMAAVHEKEIVHRDLKPDNVMILPDAGRPFGLRVKVLDFGAAKLPQTLDGRVRTEAGAIIGTPAYMSPEQCAGEDSVDGKADVYALGILLFQMLTGSLPFDAKLSFEHLAAHLRKTPRPLHDLLPSVPEPLAELVREMLRKAPAERPSMQDVVVRLENLLAAPSLGFSLSMRPVSAEGSAAAFESAVATVPPPPSRGRRRMLISTGILITLGAVTVTALLYQLRHRHTAPLHHEPEAVVRPVAPRTVRWDVVSTPPGADVVSADAKLLGSTPWRVERPLSMGETTLILRHPGYEDAPLVLQNQRDSSRSIALVPIPPPEPPPKTPAAAAPPSREQIDSGPGSGSGTSRDKPGRVRAKRGKSEDVEVKLMFD